MKGRHKTKRIFLQKDIKTVNLVFDTLFEKLVYRMLTYWRELNQIDNLPFAENKWTTIDAAKTAPNDILSTL